MARMWILGVLRWTLWPAFGVRGVRDSVEENTEENR